MIKRCTYSFYICLCCSLLIISCSEPKKEFVIHGKITNQPRSQKIILEKREVNDVITADTATTDKNGNFILRYNYDNEPALYTININNIALPIIVDVDNMSFSADWDRIDDYQVTHSRRSSELIDFVSRYDSINHEWAAMKLVMDSLLASNAGDSIKLEVQRRGDALDRAMTGLVEQMADTSHNMPLIFYITSIYLDPNSNADYFRKLAAALPIRFNNQKLALEFAELLKNKQKAEEEKPTGLQTGDTAFEFTLPDINNNPVSLSSFRGHYVLLSFWASWCPPCRGDNVYLSALYHQYKDRNFTIVGVSLDDSRTDWLNALKQDNISWPNLSDLKKWRSSVVILYRIHSIPTSYLIDPQGKIIGKNIAYDDLSQFLNKNLQQQPDSAYNQ